jgi:putative ATPase
VLFLDEIHRFSKAQQDSLLGAVESGVLTLVAATTENPSFSVIKPLISRSLVIALEPLSTQDIKEILVRALNQDLLLEDTKASEEALDYISEIASGDARRALTLLEAASLSNSDIDLDVAKSASENVIAYDAKGDVHYDTISAFITSVRGSDPDAAIHYLARMIAGGEDPRFIARRLILLASEDIGLADPTALNLAVAAHDSVSLIGMPEGRIPLAEVTIYLALAPKSNSAYLAINQAMSDVRDGFAPAIPASLRSNYLSKAESEDSYIYPHDDARAVVSQVYAEAVPAYFEPKSSGFEKTLVERWPALKRIIRDNKS